MASARGSLGILRATAHCRRMSLGGTFAVVFAPALATKDEFREAQEVGPGLGVIVRRDSGQGGEKATNRASSAAFGMCVLSGAREERTSARCGVWTSFCDSGDGVVKGWVLSGTARSGPGGDETGADRTNMEGTVGHPQVEDQAFQEPRGVHLNEGLETLFRGPVLSLFFMRRWAAKLSREGQRQTRFARREKGPHRSRPILCDGQSVPPRHLGAALRCRVSRSRASSHLQPRRFGERLRRDAGRNS